MTFFFSPTSPALVSFGSPLGLQEISGEPSTYDGVVFDAFGEVPAIIGGDQSVIRAVDGLQYGTRDALYVAFQYFSVLYF